MAGALGQGRAAPGRADRQGRPAVQDRRGLARHVGPGGAGRRGQAGHRRPAGLRDVRGPRRQELGRRPRPRAQRDRRRAARALRRGRGPDDLSGGTPLVRLVRRQPPRARHRRRLTRNRGRHRRRADPGAVVAARCRPDVPPIPERRPAAGRATSTRSPSSPRTPSTRRSKRPTSPAGTRPSRRRRRSVRWPGSPAPRRRRPGPRAPRQLTRTGLHQLLGFIRHIPSSALAEMDGVDVAAGRAAAGRWRSWRRWR